MEKRDPYSKKELREKIIALNKIERKQAIIEMKRRGIFDLESIPFSKKKVLIKNPTKQFLLVQQEKKQEQRIIGIENKQIIFSFPELGEEGLGAAFDFSIIPDLKEKHLLLFVAYTKEQKKKTSWLCFFNTTTLEFSKAKFKLDSEANYFKPKLDPSKRFILISSQFDDFPEIEVFDLEKSKVIHFDCEELIDLGYIEKVSWGKTLNSIIIECDSGVERCEPELDWYTKSVILDDYL